VYLGVDEQDTMKHSKKEKINPGLKIGKIGKKALVIIYPSFFKYSASIGNASIT